MFQFVCQIKIAQIQFHFQWHLEVNSRVFESKEHSSSVVKLKQGETVNIIKTICVVKQIMVQFQTKYLTQNFIGNNFMTIFLN